MRPRAIGFAIGCLAALAAANPAASAQLDPVRLRCEGETNPLGIDAKAPRLSWQLESNSRGERQLAYQILVARSADTLDRDQGDLYDSGRVPSDQSQFVPYSGRALESREHCAWKVRVWDREGKPSAWSTPARWTMGLLQPADWQGRWIASDLRLMDYQRYLRALPDSAMESEVHSVVPMLRLMGRDAPEAPAVWMRKEFAGAQGLRRATLRIAGLGFHEVYLNGERVGDHYLDPTRTDYAKRVCYVTHDVTRLIRPGSNALGVVLGNGWFNLITPHLLRYYAADYIAPPRLRVDLELEFADGERRIIGTDETWKCTTDGPIRFNCVLGGETYDARRELTGWDQAGFDDRTWKSAHQVEAPSGRLVADSGPPVRKLGRLPAVSVTRQGDAWRFDLGVETVGWARLRVRGKPGQLVTIRYVGVGSHTLGRYQTCEYLCRGGGTETYEPRFCYGGFRYVDVEGLTEAPAVSDLEAEWVATDLEPTGAFACSDERLTALEAILVRTLRNFVVQLPSDPTREKSAWTQDAETVFPEMAYLFDAAPIFVRWQRDFLDAVHENGYVPPVAPGRFDGPYINGPWWGGAVVYNPWQLYQFYGDAGILAESYPAMKRYFAFLAEEAKHDTLARKYLPAARTFPTLATGASHDDIVEWGLGDWLNVGGGRKGTPVPFVATAAYAWYARILSLTATLLDKPEEARGYREDAERIRASFNRVFFNPGTGQYASGSQTAQLLPLALDLAPEAGRPLALRGLTERIAQDGDHLSTGFVGTPLLLNGLTDLGRPDLAYRIATQPGYPGFIDSVLARGLTVMRENWQGGGVQMPSLQGPIGAWFFYSLAGIRADPAQPGFKTFIIRPELVGDLSWVKAHFDGPYGRIAVEWRRRPDRFELNVAIPPNTRATVDIPAAAGAHVLESGRPAAHAEGVTLVAESAHLSTFTVGSGEYRFVALGRP